MVVTAPSLAAITHWFAPFPPKPIRNSDPNIVSPGLRRIRMVALALPWKLVADSYQVPEDGGDEHDGRLLLLGHHCLSCVSVSAPVAANIHTYHTSRNQF